MDCFDKQLFTLIAEKMIILGNEKIEFNLIGGMRFTERIVSE